MKKGWGKTDNIVIIGGGASGLMAAVSAGRNGAESITVIEKNERPARKLMITGKGRCNVTNNCDRDTLIKNTVHGGKFLYSAFSLFGSDSTMEFFENLGVSLKTERGNRVFPVSDKAVTIVDALTNEAKKYADIICGEAVSVMAQNGKVTAVQLKNKKIIPADAVIIATGGKSYPLTGSTGDGYKFAKELGHTVTSVSPSLINLVCHEGFCENLAGLTLKNVTVSLKSNKKAKPVFSEMGELLFTHTGVSGPLALSASAYINDVKTEKYTLSVDLKPALSEDALDKRILRDFSENLNRDFINSLSKLLPKSLVPVIVKLSGIEPSKKVNQISAAERKKLCSVLKNLILTVTALGDISEAVITRGGITLKEINPATMESKLCKGLYFAGEVMDVDAFTGGFNLQIAFSSGNLAGKSAAEKGEEL